MWTATETQRAAVTAAQEHDYGIDVTALCQAVGIARQTYYGWFETEGFRAWWNAELDRWATLQKGRVVGAMIEAAVNPDAGVRGSAADRKLFLERYDEGYAPKQRQEHSGEMAVKSITDLVSASNDGGFARGTRLRELMANPPGAG